MATKLISRGYFVDGPEDQGCDMMVCGLRVDVKSSIPQYPTSPAVINPQYGFAMGNARKRRKCDLFIMWMRDLDILFFVPQEVVTTNKMRIVYPNSGYRVSKYAQYEERWDILDQMIADKNNQPGRAGKPVRG